MVMEPTAPVCGRWVKEPFNTFSHLAGTLLSIAGLVVLLVLGEGRAWQTVAVAIYGASLVLLFTASTLLHALHSSPELESRLERFDYACIFVLIAGTYTPLCLITLRGPWGWSLLAVEWTLAIGGVLSCVSGKVGRHRLRTVIYLIMGWLAMIAIVPLMQMLSTAGLMWLLAGGVAYSVGAVVFLADRPKLWRSPQAAHGLWHLFVLAGAACHFVLVVEIVR